MSSLPWTEEDQTVVGVDLYRTDDYVPVGRVGLPPILNAAFMEILRGSFDGVRFTLFFHAVEDKRRIAGQPAIVNLRSSHGFVHVRITRHGRLIYQHPHTVAEIVGRPLQRMLAEQEPDEEHWGFGVAGPGLEHVALVRPVPRAEGSVDLAPRSGRPRRFHLEELPGPEPPLAALTDLGIDGDAARGRARDASDGVVFTPEVHEQFLRTMPFSREMEEGGFLIGEVYRERDRPDRHLVRVIDAVPAERTGASLLQFTFTGESFLRVNDAVARRGPTQHLVGWYHTHLFAPTDELGLSSIDLELHARTFRRSWHIAALVNIDENARVLRVYGAADDGMELLPYWVGSSWTP